jgi:AAA ATPase domain
MGSGIFDQRSDDVPPPPMFGAGEESGAASSQAALFERMQEILAEAARENPLVLILEDMHWSDPASLELLRFVSRNLDGLRILLVATYRDDEVTRRSPLYRLLPTLVRESGSSCAGWAIVRFRSWLPPGTRYPRPTKGRSCPTSRTLPQEIRSSP